MKPQKTRINPARRGDETERLRSELTRAQARYDEVTREFLAFQSVSNDLLQTSHLDEVLASVLRGLEEGLGFAFGAIAVVDEHSSQVFMQMRPDHLLLERARNSVGLAPERIRIKLGDENNVLVRVLRDNRLEVMRDLGAWLEGTNLDGAAIGDFLKEEGIRLLAAAPMNVGGSIGGLLLGASPHPGMTSTERESLQNFANQAGMAIENARLVADLRRMRDQLAKTNTELQELEVMKEGLVQMVVHDMKNPITSVRGYLELLMEEPEDRLSADLNNHVRIAYESSGRLLNMVRDLLDISRMEEGVFEAALAPTDIAEFVHEVVSRNQATALRQDKTIVVEIEEALPKARADADLIERIIANLVSNAIKHTHRGSSITVRAQLDETPGYLRVSVQDNGAGIAKEHHDRIFEKFTMVKNRSRGTHMNTGLGLTFCKMAVEAHGGKIWLESTEGQGTTFFFTLEAVSDPPDQPDTAHGDKA